MQSVLDALQPWLDQADTAALTAMAIFLRVSAIAFFLPGVGERLVPARIKLAVAFAFSAVAWPLIMPKVEPLQMSLESFGYAFLAEAVCGLLIGFSVRLMIFALQIAGAIAAQSLSISQIFGPGVAPDPEPTIATFLTLGGIALAMSFDLHVKAAALIVDSYVALPFGAFPLSGDTGDWSSQRVAQAFSLGISLALPFILISFVYNLALGFINRAMPQLMVAFVGMPAITWLGIMMLGVTASAALMFWHDRFDAVLYAPLGLRP